MCREEEYIARIISLQEVQEYILPQNGERSTFHLRSAISYRDLPIKKSGDPDEMQCRGKGFHACSANNYLISCWSYLGNKNNPEDLFNIAQVDQERNDVAIVSTIGKMAKFLQNTIYNEYHKKEVFAELRHERVQYYKKGVIVVPSDHKGRANFALDVIFKKEEKSKNQNEYRFALREIGLQRLQNLVFYANPGDYIEGIWINRRKHKNDQGIIAALMANELNVAIFKNSIHLIDI